MIISRQNEIQQQQATSPKYNLAPVTVSASSSPVPQPATSTATYQEQFSPTVRCYTCQQLGHIKRVCPYGRQQQQRDPASFNASRQSDVYRSNMLSAYHESRTRESREDYLSSKLSSNPPPSVSRDVVTTPFGPADAARGGEYETKELRREESSVCTCAREEESEKVDLDVKIEGRHHAWCRLVEGIRSQLELCR